MQQYKDRQRLWKDVVTSIEELALSGCYEKVNNKLSFGRVEKLREKTLRLLGNPRILVDAGSGPGTSTLTALRVLPRTHIIMMDPSIRMLRYAVSRIPPGETYRVSAVSGVFENMPFRDSSVDAITAMFSFRDAAVFEDAVREFWRVLRPGGRVSILDIYRPSRLVLPLVDAYFRIMVPLAVALSGCPGELLKYRSFPETIHKMLTKKELYNLFNKYFNIIKIYTLVPGLAIIYAEKQTTKTAVMSGDGREPLGSEPDTL